MDDQVHITKLFSHEDNVRDRCGTRRAYPRVPYVRPLKYIICTKKSHDDVRIGDSCNLSQGGMLFEAHQETPPISSVIAFETDLDWLSKCIDVENKLLCLGSALLGKVVRVIRNKTAEHFEIGVSFITHEERQRADVQQALAVLA